MSEESEAERIPGHPPPLAGVLARTLIGFALAAAVLGCALLRERSAGSPLDPLALLFRVLGAMLTLRALLRAAQGAQLLRLAVQARRHHLVLGETLRWERPEGTFVVPREDVLAVTEPGDWGARSGPRLHPVFVAMRPQAGTGLLVLPPIFGRTPGTLAETLMRWRGPLDVPDAPTFPEPTRLGSRLYDRAAQGKVPPDATLLRHGWGWLRRAPVAAPLVALVFLEGLARFPEATAALGALPLGAVVLCLLVPLGWLALTRREVAPRRGVALLLTPAEVLMRTRSGILRARWSSLADIRVDAKPSFSLLEGYTQTRRLVFDRGEDQTPIRYDEAYLGVPAEAAALIAGAYRRGWVRRA